MCGIWVSINAPDAAAGLSAAAHRGPDGEGWARFDTPAGRLEMGHRRLAIYDPTPASDQPVYSADKRYTLIFNGALYNYRELREQLSHSGHRFVTTGDSEVFLKAFLEWGTGCFARIDGMFATVIFDNENQSLIFARDRFGEKPLHMLCANGQLAIASEIPQLFAGLRHSPRIADQPLRQFLATGQLDRTEQTLFDQAIRFPAAHFAKLSLARSCSFDAKDILTTSQPFWLPPKPEDMSISDAQSALRDAMDTAIARQLVADVPVGGCLSGGLDSSIILATACRLREAASDPFICVSAIFDETDDQGESLSERPFVDAAIKDRNVELIEVHPGETSVRDRLDDILATQAEPFPGTSICAQYFVFEAARKAGIKVMLDGQGADELFAGYAPMAAYGLADRIAAFDVKAAQEFRSLVETPSDLSSSSLSRGVWRALVSERLRRALLGVIGRFPPKSGPASAIMAPAFEQDGGLGRLDTLIKRLVVSDSLPALLRYEDRNAMAFAVETRLPYLSAGVSDLAFRIPAKLKVANGFPKDILRSTFEDCLPKLIARRRRKLGFVTPQQKWLRGEIGSWVDEQMDTAIDQLSSVLLPEWIEKDKARRTNQSPPDEATFRVALTSRWITLSGSTV